ncbi:PIG-L deacetylase family protein [Brachybacterium sp. AOP42-E1-35]|uniref:PIG-L deacetylase family protein n=1 Tax=Brachybacterium sp. AOP42-E1-35 TaxID=3457664 RepID=UPI00402A640F
MTRVLLIGAHPDDCEFEAGGIAALVTRAGGTVRCLSLTDGRAGHHQISSDDLVPIRRAEATAAASALGAESVVLDFEDGWLDAGRDVRTAVIRQLREFGPDIVISPRPSDYHPDHRAAGEAARDAAYVLMVPHIVPDVPVPAKRPILAHHADPFTQPRPFAPDLLIDIDDGIEQKLDAVMQHASQVLEWLPHINGFEHELEKLSGRERTAWIRERERNKAVALADRLRGSGAEVLGSADMRHAEALEVSEYGAPSDGQRLAELLRAG